MVKQILVWYQAIFMGYQFKSWGEMIIELKLPINVLSYVVDTSSYH